MPTRRTLLLLTALVIVVTRAGSATVTAVARTEEYRNKCLLDFSSRLFGISPGNFLWNENFLFKFFEIPKAGAAEFKFSAAHLIPDTTSIHQGAWEPARKVRGHEGKHPRHPEEESVLFVLFQRPSYRLVAQSGGALYLEFSVARDPIDRFVAVVNLFHQVERSEWKNITSAAPASPRTGRGSGANEGTGVKSFLHRAIDAVLEKVARDGWFNWHFWPQAMYLSSPEGKPRALDFIFDRDNMQEVFDTLTDVKGTARINASTDALRELFDKEGKAKVFWEPRLFTPELVQRHNLRPEHVVAICDVYLVDFCCFSYDLPQVCLDHFNARDHKEACSSEIRHGHGRFLSEQSTDRFFHLDSLKPAHLYPGAKKYVDSVVRSRLNRDGNEAFQTLLR